MKMHPLIKAFSVPTNLNNFLLLKDKSPTVVTHIYPTTTMSGSYSRLKQIAVVDYETMKAGNKTFTIHFGGQSIFDSEPTDQNMLLIKEMVDDINDKFFKKTCH